MRRTRSRPRRGVVLVIAALCLPVMIGVMALAIDGGLMMATQRRAQIAADSACYAAVRAYHKAQTDGQGADPLTAATTAATAYAAACGFPLGTSSQNGVVVSVVSSPPPRYASADLTLRTVVSTQPLRAFGGIFGGDPPVVSAESVSVRLRDRSGGSIVLLNPSASNSLSVSGGCRIGGSGPDDPRPTIMVKSTANTAANFSGGSETYAELIKIAGGYKLTGASTINGDQTSPDAVQTGVNAASINDPLESTFSPPLTSGLPTRSVPSGWKPSSASSPVQLQPGYYASGMNFGSGVFYAMAPGVYHLKGNFNAAGGSTVTADGVTIYLESGNFSVSGGGDVAGSGSTVYLANGNFSLSGGANTRLSAPTSGDYKGAVVIQGPTKNASGNYPSRSFSLSGGANTSVDGTIYAPGSSLSISGGTYTVDPNTRWIADKLNISGGAHILPRTGSSDYEGEATFHLAQ